MVWYNNPESVRAIQAAQREGYSPERTRLLRLIRTQRDLPVLSN